MTNFGILLKFFNEELNKQQNEEFELLKSMRELEYKDQLQKEERKESTFTIIFKVNRFEIYFIEKNYRFLTFNFNLLYLEFQKKFNEYLFFFDLSTVNTYLLGGDKLVLSSDQQKQNNNSFEQRFQELGPFQPRSIFDKRYGKEKNNESDYLMANDQGQKKGERKIFGSHNPMFSNQYNKQDAFISQDGQPTSHQNLQSNSHNQFNSHNQSHQYQQPNLNHQSNQNNQQSIKSHKNEIISYQSEKFLERNTRGSDIFVLDQNKSMGDHQVSQFQSQFNQSDVQSQSPQSKKRKQIFEQDFDIQNEFFDEKQKKENEKKKIDLNQLMMKAKDRRDIFETKSNLIIKFQTIQTKNEVNCNAQIPEIKINQDTRDVKDLLNYFKQYPLKEFIKIIQQNISKPSNKNIDSVVSKVTKLKRKVDDNIQSSTLQFSTIKRPLAAPNKNQTQQESKQNKLNDTNNQKIKEFNIESNLKDGLLQFDEDDDEFQNENKINKKNERGIYTNPDPDLIELGDYKDNDPNFPKEYQSLLFEDNKNNNNNKLEAIIEDPLETIGQTTYKTQTKPLNQFDDQVMSKLNNQMQKENIQSVILGQQKQKISLFHIFNYYLYHKITGLRRRRLQQKEKKIQFIDILDEYVGKKHFNICFTIGSISIDAKDHFSENENENIVSIQIPPGQIIINFNSQIDNRHIIDVYHFKMTTTNKFKIIKYMINRIKKMIELSQIFDNDEEDFDLDL